MKKVIAEDKFGWPAEKVEDTDDNEIANNVLEDLLNAVHGSFSKNKSISEIVKESLKKAKLTGKEDIRRDFDGISEASWLVEKMIGELLIDGEIKW